MGIYDRVVNQKHFCAVCGREWGIECSSKKFPGTHNELEYYLPLGKKIEYLQEAVSWLEHKMYFDDLENFKKALAYFNELKVDYQFTHHQVI